MRGKSAKRLRQIVGLSLRVMVDDGRIEMKDPATMHRLAKRLHRKLKKGWRSTSNPKSLDSLSSQLVTSLKGTNSSSE